MSKTITLDTRVPGIMKNQTLREIMEKELSSTGYNFTQIDPRPHATEPSKLPENVRLNTTKEFKDNQKAFLSLVATVYGSMYVTRQMVVAVNLLNGFVSCPNYLNKNAFCMTLTRGLYHLPEWAFTPEVRKSVRETMKARAAEYKEAQKLAAAEAKKAEADAKTSESESDETSPKKKAAAKKTSAKKPAKKTSKKKSEPASNVSAVPETEPESINPPADEVQPEIVAEVDPNLADEVGAETEAEDLTTAE